MKLKGIIGLLSVSLISSFSVGLSLSQNSYYESEAWFQEKYLYVDLGENNGFSNPYIHYNDGEDANVSLSLVSNNIYVTSSEIPLGVFTSSDCGFEVCSSVGDYSSIWLSGGSSNLLQQDNYNYICLDLYDSSSEASIKSYGYYGARTTNPSEATYKTQRVWLNNSNEYFYDNNKYINVVGYFHEEKYYVVDMLDVINTYDGSTYYYVDIPYQVNSVHFLRMNKSGYIVYNDITTYLSYGMCYFANMETMDKFEISVGTVYGASAAILGMVVESYLTYGKDDSNGCTETTIKNLFNTWFRNKSASSDELKTTKIKDYTGYDSKTGSYEGYEKTGLYSVSEKWNTMCSQVSIDPNTGEHRSIDISWFQSEKFKATLIIGGVALVSIGGVIVFLIIKKKRGEQEF